MLAVAASLRGFVDALAGSTVASEGVPGVDSQAEGSAGSVPQQRLRPSDAAQLIRDRELVVSHMLALTQDASIVFENIIERDSADGNRGPLVASLAVRLAWKAKEVVTALLTQWCRLALLLGGPPASDPFGWENDAWVRIAPSSPAAAALLQKKWHDRFRLNTEWLAAYGEAESLYSLFCASISTAVTLVCNLLAACGKPTVHAAATTSVVGAIHASGLFRAAACAASRMLGPMDRDVLLAHIRREAAQPPTIDRTAVRQTSIRGLAGLAYDVVRMHGEFGLALENVADRAPQKGVLPPDLQLLRRQFTALSAPFFDLLVSLEEYKGSLLSLVTEQRRSGLPMLAPLLDDVSDSDKYTIDNIWIMRCFEKRDYGAAKGTLAEAAGEDTRNIESLANLLLESQSTTAASSSSSSSSLATTSPSTALPAGLLPLLLALRRRHYATPSLPAVLLQRPSLIRRLFDASTQQLSGAAAAWADYLTTTLSRVGRGKTASGSDGSQAQLMRVAMLQFVVVRALTTQRALLLLANEHHSMLAPPSAGVASASTAAGSRAGDAHHPLTRHLHHSCDVLSSLGADLAAPALACLSLLRSIHKVTFDVMGPAYQRDQSVTPLYVHISDHAITHAFLLLCDSQPAQAAAARQYGSLTAAFSSLCDACLTWHTDTVLPDPHQHTSQPGVFSYCRVGPVVAALLRPFALLLSSEQGLAAAHAGTASTSVAAPQAAAASLLQSTTGPALDRAVTRALASHASLFRPVGRSTTSRRDTQKPEDTVCVKAMREAARILQLTSVEEAVTAMRDNNGLFSQLLVLF